ncbi:MAG: hypothetical protein WCV84_04685 [Patescibacteria group bacterium]
MQYIAYFLVYASIAALIAGLIKPNLFKLPNRGKAGMVLGAILFGSLVIFGATMPKESSHTNTATNESSQVAPVEKQDLHLTVTSQSVKEVNGKCRYFFDIRNTDEKAFMGTVSITLTSKEGRDIWTEEFSSKESPISTVIGKSVYFDINTCPISKHGDAGINQFSFTAKMEGSTAQQGAGEVKQAIVK